MTISSPRATFRGLASVPLEWPDPKEHTNLVARATRDLQQRAVQHPLTVVSATATYSMADIDLEVRCNATSALFTVPLLSAVGRAGRRAIIKKIDSSSHTVTIVANGSETIDGAANIALSTQYDGREIISNGTNWDVVNRGGTVQSVGIVAPSEITVSGSPVTGSGNITLSWTNENANVVFAGPSSGNATTPAFRSLVVADLPTAITAAHLSLTSAHLYVGNGTGVAADVAMSGDATMANTGALTIGNATVTEAKISLSDVTTLNVSSSAHGFVPKANGSGTKFLDDTGAFSTIPGTAGGAATLIAKNTPSSGNTTTFTSIPATYTHLLLYGSGRSDSAGVAAIQLNVTFNNDSAGNYDYQGIQTGSAVAEQGANAASNLPRCFQFTAATAPTGRAGNGRLWILNYADTTYQKTCLYEAACFQGNTTATMNTNIGGGNWRSTSAINRIDIICASGNYTSGCTFSLYGIS